MAISVTLRQGARFGLLAVAVWTGLYATAAAFLARTPQGYNPIVNHVSDLGHPSSPGAWAFNAGCILAGLLFIPYGLAVARDLGGRVATAGAILFVAASGFLVLVGVFPEESPNNLHFLASAGFFLLLTASALVLSLPLHRSRRFGPLSGYLAAATVAGAAATVATFGTAANPIIEHLAVFLGLIWSAWNVNRMWAAGPAPARPRVSLEEG